MHQSNRTLLPVVRLVGAFAIVASFALDARAQSEPDHLECYKIKDPQAKATYTADLAGLAVEPGCSIKVPAKMACVPTTKTNVTPPPPGGGGSGTPNGFACYAVKCPKTDLPAVALNDQFGSRSATASQSKMLCAPIECAPETCPSLGAECGSLPDGCGGILECGTCAAPETCGGSGTANLCGCTPETCTSLGASCGSPPDGCGNPLNCGSCVSPESCGGGGTPWVCGICTPDTCLSLNANCGSLSDGCGGPLECGTCTAPQFCGGGGVPNQCGGNCTPLTCTVLGATCGSPSDGCGGTLECGTCTAPQVCLGSPAQCVIP